MLEVGGNIGRSTIVAAEMIGPSGRVYSCEANQDQKQKQADHAKGLIEQKRVVLLPPISDTKLYQGGWFTTTEKAAPKELAYTGMKESDWSEIPTLSYAKLVETVPKWDTIIADCEGCFHTLYHAHPEIVDEVTLLIVENDPRTVAPEDAHLLREGLLAQGFVSNCETSTCFHEVWWRP